MGQTSLMVNIVGNAQGLPTINSMALRTVSRRIVKYVGKSMTFTIGMGQLVDLQMLKNIISVLIVYQSIIQENTYHTSKNTAWAIVGTQRG